MPGTPVDLGKFKGGLNNIADEASIDDDQLAEVINFDLDTDGTLISRPAITPAPESGGSVTGDMVILGYYTDIGNVTYAVLAVDTTTRIYNISTGVWTQIWATRASGMVQYDNKIVLSSATSSGGYWESGTFTSMASMPFSAGITFYQERFWAWGIKGSANATTVWFSNLTVISPASSIFNWTPASDFFTVSKGDGQWITSITADISSLVIFRSGSTWGFSYPSTPFSGTLRPLNVNIGADNAYSVVRFENYFYVVHSGTVYQFINFQFYPLNSKRVEFGPESVTGTLTADIRLSIFGRRLILWHYGNTYVYSITIGAWTRWRSEVSRAAQFLQVPPSSESVSNFTAYAVTGDSTAAKQKLWFIANDVLQLGTGESMACMIRTKAYSMSQPAQYKALKYWTVEVRSAGAVTGTSYPVTLQQGGATWDAMDLTTWDVLSNGNWDNLLVILPKIVDEAPYASSGPIAKLVRFIRAYRFLKVIFEVYMECDGTAATSPARIYSITPYLGIKANVSKKVN